MAVYEFLFLHYNRRQFADCLRCVALLGKRIEDKATTDPTIKGLREKYFFSESLFFYTSLVFTLLMGVMVYIPGLMRSEIYLPHPAANPTEVEGFLPRASFFVAYLCISWGCTWGGCLIVCVGFFTGNLYSQVILNVQIMAHEIRKCGSGFSPRNSKTRAGEEAKRKADLIVIIQEYQFLRELVNKMSHVFQGLLLALAMSTMFLLTAISIEFALVISVDQMRAVRPAMFFTFMTGPFFYWCWLGQRLHDLVSGSKIYLRIECELSVECSLSVPGHLDGCLRIRLGLWRCGL